MKEISFIKSSGFEVLYNSENWRIAVHAYEESVNSLSAFQEWGLHEDSREAFVLLEGQAWLAVSQDGEGAEDYRLFYLEKGKLYVVEEKEYHAIILKPGSQVLIAENQNMTNSRTKPASPEVLDKIRKKIKI